MVERTMWETIARLRERSDDDVLVEIDPYDGSIDVWVDKRIPSFHLSNLVRDHGFLIQSNRRGGDKYPVGVYDIGRIDTDRMKL